MPILALETSTELGSCALWLAGEVRQRLCPEGQPHSETLLPLVRELLAEAGLAISQLDAIAFGVGPGAFTGLRVACGVAQGLAVAIDRPVVPITSLAALAAESGQGEVLALLDARMGEVYAGQYQRDATGDYALLGEIRVQPPATVPLPGCLPRAPRLSPGAPINAPAWIACGNAPAWIACGNAPAWIACGNAPAAYPELAARLAAAGIDVVPGLLPRAASVARLAAPRLARGEGIDPALAAPLYIRDKVAKTVAERLGEGGKA